MDLLDSTYQDLKDDQIFALYNIISKSLEYSSNGLDNNLDGSTI